MTKFENQPKNIEEELVLIESSVKLTGFGILISTEIEDKETLVLNFVPDVEKFGKDYKMLTLAIFDMMTFTAMRVKQYNIKEISCRFRIAGDKHSMDTRVEDLVRYRSHTIQNARKKNIDRKQLWKGIRNTDLKNWIKSSTYVRLPVKEEADVS